MRASVEALVGVIEQLPGLPLVEDEDVEWIDWEIDGVEGRSNWYLHVLDLGCTSDPAAAEEITALTGALTEGGVRRWGPQERLVVAGFNDSDDMPWQTHFIRAAVIRELEEVGTNRALWWTNGANAVIVVANPATRRKVRRAAVVVLPVHWIKTPDRAEAMRSSPVVADFLSEDPERIEKVRRAVDTTREPVIFEPLAAALPALETLGYPKVEDISFDRIRIFAAGTCLCADYLNRLTYDPERESARGHVRIVEVRQEQPTHRPQRICACTDCGRRFDVEEGEYHATWWQWTEPDSAGS